MIDDGKKSIALGYALTYAVGISALNAMSTVFAVISQSAAANGATTMIFIAAAHFALLLGYALGFVVLAAALDLLTRRSPQPMNALSVGLAAFATIDLLLQSHFLGTYTSHAA